MQLLNTQLENEIFESKSVIAALVKIIGNDDKGDEIVNYYVALPWIGITDYDALIKRFASVTFP